MPELVKAPLWQMNCKHCTFLAHDPETGTDWYLNTDEVPCCLLVKYGDRDYDYDFHLFLIPALVDPQPENLQISQNPEALQKAWAYTKELLTCQFMNVPLKPPAHSATSTI